MKLIRHADELGHPSHYEAGHTDFESVGVERSAKDHRGETGGKVLSTGLAQFM